MTSSKKSSVMIGMIIFFLFGIAVIMFLPSHALSQPDVTPYCTEGERRGQPWSEKTGCGSGNGGGGGGGGPVTPPGKTPEQLEMEREKRDLSEATLDTNDKGVEAFEKGDWARAIEYFKEALDYSPDDEGALHNLKRAQDSLALAQAEAAARKSKEATISPTANEAKAKAGKCFDKGCAPEPPSSNPPSSNVVDLSKVGLRPQVPEWMTKDPRYIGLDNEMKILEKQYNEKQEKLKRIDEQLSRGEGNKNDLTMQRVNLKQGMSNDDNKKADVRRRMVDLSVQLGEEAQQETSTQTSSGQQTKSR